MVTKERPATRTAKRPPSARKAPRARKKSWDDMNIFEKIEELGRQIPPDELARHPVDGARNLHHYLHGAPKQDPD
jgi:hypothetical protein